MDNRVLGQIGENMAADVMRAKGFRILKQNYRCQYGEIDIVAERMGEVSFVEVKTRQGFKYGRPCEVIGHNKKTHIRKAARCYLDEAKKKGFYTRRYSFDVMEVVVEHTRDAF